MIGVRLRTPLLRRNRKDSRPFYLVSAAGLPNYGDEILTRVWLDWLAKNRPGVPVWLDCPEPGRANHLFRDSHPLLRTTNTLWHLAFGARGSELFEEAKVAAQLVTDLGSPRLDLGLEDLRSMRSVHLLGGGYLNSVWENHLLILPALVTLKRVFGVPIYATGQGVMPLSDTARELVAEWVEQFDLFEARDLQSAEAVGAVAGRDDAFLAFENTRNLYSVSDSPDVMLLLQGDFVRSESAHGLLEIAANFVRERGANQTIGLIESIPPDDSWALAHLRDRGIDPEFYPFRRLWQEGLPARQGQSWLSTRFHFHLLAAAAGARGAVIELGAEYYGVKHGSLRALGTGWSHLHDLTGAQAPTPTANPDFPAISRQIGSEKARVARLIYA